MRVYRKYIDDVDYGLRLEDNMGTKTIIDRFYLCGDRRFLVTRKWKKLKPNGKWYKYESNKFFL